MSIHVNCPACGKTLKAPDLAAGKIAKCPGCGKAVDIPRPTSSAGQASPGVPLATQPAAKPHAPASAASAPSAAGTVSVTCPACGKTLKAPPSAAGKKAKCSGCGTVISLPGQLPSRPQVVSGDELQEIPAPLGLAPLPGFMPQMPAVGQQTPMMFPQMPGGPMPQMPAPGFPQMPGSPFLPMPTAYAAEDFAPAAQQQFYPVAAAPAAAPVVSEGPRRPCPECGELILESAAVCRFCGAVLDAKLRSGGRRRRSSGGGQSDGVGIASVVLGIVALVCTFLGLLVCLAFPVGLICAIVGLIMSFNSQGSLRKAGVILNAIPLVLTLILVFLALLGLGALALSGGPGDF